jgi:rsbT antagonist protein RsbS
MARPGRERAREAAGDTAAARLLFPSGNRLSFLDVQPAALDTRGSRAMSRTLRDITNVIRLRGADTVIVGIQPEVAFATVQLGLAMEGVATALDLEEGLAHLQQRAARNT